MATSTLVELQIAEGTMLLDALRDRGFDVIVACWVQGDEDELWYLYIASSDVDRLGLKGAYGELHTVIRSTSHLAIDPFRVRLVSSTDPLVAAITDLRRRMPGPLSTRLSRTNFAGRSIEAAYIYP